MIFFNLNCERSLGIGTLVTATCPRVLGGIRPGLATAFKTYFGKDNRPWGDQLALFILRSRHSFDLT